MYIYIRKKLKSELRTGTVKNDVSVQVMFGKFNFYGFTSGSGSAKFYFFGFSFGSGLENNNS